MPNSIDIPGLYQLRTRAGLTQQQLADTIGRSRTALSLLETGRMGASTSTLHKLVRVFPDDAGLRHLSSQYPLKVARQGVAARHPAKASGMAGWRERLLA